MSEYITLKDNRDFSGLYRRGKSFVGPVLVTYVLKNKSDNLRFGITTGKKIGKAVRRTRSRRVIREAYYKLYPDIKKGYKAFSSLHQITLMLPLIATAKTYKI